MQKVVYDGKESKMADKNKNKPNDSKWKKILLTILQTRIV